MSDTLRKEIAALASQIQELKNTIHAFEDMDDAAKMRWREDDSEAYELEVKLVDEAIAQMAPLRKLSAQKKSALDEVLFEEQREESRQQQEKMNETLIMALKYNGEWDGTLRPMRNSSEYIRKTLFRRNKDLVTMMGNIDVTLPNNQIVSLSAEEVYDGCVHAGMAISWVTPADELWDAGFTNDQPIGKVNIANPLGLFPERPKLSIEDILYEHCYPIAPKSTPQKEEIVIAEEEEEEEEEVLTEDDNISVCNDDDEGTQVLVVSYMNKVVGVFNSQEKMNQFLEKNYCMTISTFSMNE